MKNVKITYTFKGETKQESFAVIHRFYEVYSQRAKELIMTTSSTEECPINDEILAELIQSEIQSISVHSDNDGKILNVILTDYVQIRDVSKEYNFDEGEVRLQFIFQKNFNPADVGEPVLS